MFKAKVQPSWKKNQQMSQSTFDLESIIANELIFVKVAGNVVVTSDTLPFPSFPTQVLFYWILQDEPNQKLHLWPKNVKKKLCW